MRKFFMVMSVLIGSMLFQGCTSNHLKPVADPVKAMAPEQGKALVVFMRTSSFGGAVQSTVYDGETYISTVSSGTRVAYQASPGEHMFMVIGESADFLKANLLAGKSYYVLVTPRMGVWKARFSMQPVRKSTSVATLSGWLNDTTLMEPNAEGLAWAQQNQSDIQAKKNEYLPAWLAKDKGAQTEATLNPADGHDKPVR